MQKQARFIFLLLLLLLHASCQQKAPRFFEDEKALMGTIFKVKIFYHEGETTEEKLQAATDSAFAEVNRLEQEMSEWIPESPISQANANANAGRSAVRIAPDAAHVLDMAIHTSKTTNGVFDISFKPLGKVWDVKNRKEPPAPEAIAAAKALVDYKAIRLGKDSLYLAKPGMQIGLGGIAKGYAAQVAGKALEEAGFENYVINAGGDLYFSGKKDDEHWTSGIKDPDGAVEPVLKFKVKQNEGVATSGDYENFFIYKGKRYHHIIDPGTGYPPEGYRSVTVFSRDPAKADAYATAFFILGYEASKQIAEKDTSLAFIMMDSSRTLFRSPNLSRFIEEFE